MESSSGGLIPLGGAASFGGSIETIWGKQGNLEINQSQMDGTGHGDWVSTVHVLTGMGERRK